MRLHEVSDARAAASLEPSSGELRNMPAAYIAVALVASVTVIAGLAVAGNWRGYTTRFAARDRARWLRHWWRAGAYPTPVGVRLGGVALSSFGVGILGLALQRLGAVEAGEWMGLVGVASFAVSGIAGGYVIPTIAMRRDGVKRFRRRGQERARFRAAT
jgi:hypothetical protein